MVDNVVSTDESQENYRRSLLLFAFLTKAGVQDVSVLDFFGRKNEERELREREEESKNILSVADAATACGGRINSFLIYTTPI